MTTEQLKNYRDGLLDMLEERIKFQWYSLCIKDRSGRKLNPIGECEQPMDDMDVLKMREEVMRINYVLSYNERDVEKIFLSKLNE
jgi:hypothetical protein